MSSVIVTTLFAKVNEFAVTLAIFPAYVLKPIPYPFPSVNATLCVETGPGAVKPGIVVIFGAAPTSGCVNAKLPP